MSEDLGGLKNDAFNSQVQNTVQMLAEWFHSRAIRPAIGCFAMAQLIVSMCESKEVKRMTELMLEWDAERVQ